MKVKFNRGNHIFCIINERIVTGQVKSSTISMVYVKALELGTQHNIPKDNCFATYALAEAELKRIYI